MNMLLLFLALSYQEFIKHYRGELFICDKTDPAVPDRILKSCSPSSPTRWTFDQKNNGMTLVHTPRDKTVWDVGPNNNLQLFPLHGKINQLFRFETLEGDKYQIRSQVNCVEFDPDEFKYTLKECSMKYEQLFTIPIEVLLKQREDLFGTHHYHDEFVESRVDTPFNREGKILHLTCDEDRGYHYRGHCDLHTDIIHTIHRGHH